VGVHVGQRERLPRSHDPGPALGEHLPAAQAISMEMRHDQAGDGQLQFAVDPRQQGPRRRRAPGGVDDDDVIALAHDQAVGGHESPSRHRLPRRVAPHIGSHGADFEVLTGDRDAGKESQHHEQPLKVDCHPGTEDRAGRQAIQNLRLSGPERT
jgi:hypothetical protein